MISGKGIYSQKNEGKLFKYISKAINNEQDLCICMVSVNIRLVPFYV